MTLSDSQVRAELERIDNREQTLIWLFEGAQPKISGVDLAILKALRLLAKQHEALRGIGDHENTFMDGDASMPCQNCLTMKAIAKNACKEGK